MTVLPEEVEREVERCGFRTAVDSDLGEGVDAVRVFGLVAEVACDDRGAEDLRDVHRRRSVVAVTEQRIMEAVCGDGGGEVGRWSEGGEIFEYCG